MTDKKESKGYTTIHVPTALAAIIDKLIDSQEFAFTSRSEFVKDAIRRSLERHGFYPGKYRFLFEDPHDEAIQEFLNRRIANLKRVRSAVLSSEKDQQE